MTLQSGPIISLFRIGRIGPLLNRFAGAKHLIDPDRSVTVVVILRLEDDYPKVHSKTKQ